MAHIPVQCQNCGARYKIPDSFQADFAKCKACGSQIDVKSARPGEAEPAVAKTTGGTRRPRQSATTSGSSAGTRRRGAADEDKTKPPGGSSRRAAGAGSRRRRDADEDGEAEAPGRRHYEKKKDNTPIYAGVAVLAMLVVAGVLYLVMSGPDKPGDQDQKTATAADAKKGDASKQASGKPAAAANTGAGAGDAKAETQPAAAGGAGDAKAEDAAAKKPEKPAKQPAAAKKPKGDELIAGADKVTKPEEVFKPKSILEALPQPEGLDEAKTKKVLELLATIRKEDGGTAEIRAKRELEEIGVPMIPLAVNLILDLDFSKPEDNMFCFEITELISREVDWGLGFEPVGETFTLPLGHKNAARVIQLHTMAKAYWHSDAGMEKYRKKYKKGEEEEEK